MKKLLVIDGNSIINRAFYGVRELSTSQGKPTNAVYGMINIIKHQLDTLRPDYAAVAFDRKAPTFRKKLYDGYKATRHPTPPELLAQFDDAKDVLRAMGLYVCELDGYEAKFPNKRIPAYLRVSVTDATGAVAQTRAYFREEWKK